MKKLIAILLVLCLVFAGVVGYVSGKARSGANTAVSEQAAPEQAAPEEAAAAPEEEISLRTVDLEALYALHDADEVVLNINGKDETWGEYFYALSSQVRSIENYFSAMALYYGMELDWADVAEGDDTAYAQLALSGAEDTLRQFATVEGFAEENGVTLSDKSLETIEQQRQSDRETVYANAGGDVETADEAALEEEFLAFLDSQHLSEEMYERINRMSGLYQDGFVQLYGEDAEKLSEEEVLAWLNENGYLCANHILLSTIDRSTGEALEEEVVQEKLALARELVAQLQAIEDPVELLERFAELKEEYCEDSGKVRFPEGYTFASGTMVAVFEDTAKALEEYQVSDPVESDYGYHILLRLPLTADAILSGGSGDGTTARQAAANETYGQQLQAYMDALTVQYAEGFTVPDLLQYLRES